MAPRSGTHTIDTERVYQARSSESFNRLSYARKLLKLLKVPMTVAVYGNRRQLSLSRGRALGEQSAWALLGVPPDATRESIARAIAELSELERAPFIVDLLCATPADAEG